MDDTKPIKVKKKAGRPRKILTTEQWNTAKELANMQCTRDEIASFLKMSEETLVLNIKERYGLDFSSWFKRYSGSGKASLRRRMYQMATHESRPNPIMAIWLSKQYLDMKDEQKIDLLTDQPIKFCYALNE
jgi:hypothetical protein